VLFDPPTPRGKAEVLENQLWCLEGTVAVIARNPYPAISEAHDLSATVSRQIGKEARMPLDPPTPCTKTEVLDG
jgi:hypothetical protein